MKQNFLIKLSLFILIILLLLNIILFNRFSKQAFAKKRIKYNVVFIELSKIRDLQNTLNQYGLQGWELSQMVIGGREALLIFKK